VRVLAATRHRVARPVATGHHAPLAPRARSPALWCALVVLGPAVL